MRSNLLQILFIPTLILGILASVFAFDNLPRPVTICSGASIIIKGDPTDIAADTYLWEYFQNGTWLAAPGENSVPDYLAASLLNLSNQNVIFNLRRKTTLAGAAALDSYYLVTVQPILPITNNAVIPPLTISFCGSGTPQLITGSTPLSGSYTFVYQWQRSADDVGYVNVEGANAKDYQPERITATTFFRRIAMTGGCGLSSISNSIRLTVVPSLTGNTITAPAVTEFCVSGDPEVIKGSAPLGGTGSYVYQWQQSADNVSFTTINGAVTENYDPPVLTATTYFRRLVVSGPCGNALISTPVMIQVNPELQAPVFEAAALTACTGSSVTLAVKNPLPEMTYLWYDTPELTQLLFSGKAYTTGPLSQTKTFYVTSNTGNCVSLTASSVRVAISPLPGTEAVANGGKVLTCSGAAATFNISVPNPDYTYNWYASASGGMPLGSGSSWVAPAVTLKTTYYLEVVNKEGCSAPLRQPVEVDVAPMMVAPEVTVEQATSNSITFRWSPVSGASGYQVSTDNGQSYQLPSSGANGLWHTIAGLKGSEAVSIRVKAIGVMACQDAGNETLTTAETLKEYDGIFVPNAFTPNADGKNDIAYVRSETVKTLRFYIYNQWGKQLFYSSSVARGWDGSLAGVQQPVGVYMYAVEATMNNGQVIRKKGTITLIR